MPNLMRLAVLDDWNGKASEIVDWTVLGSNLQVDFFKKYFSSSSELIVALKDYDCVMLMRERTQFDRTVIDGLSDNLRLIITSGPKNSVIDLDAAKEHGIVVSGTKSLKGPPTELTIALMLNLARHISTENRAFQMGGVWQSTLGVSLEGKTLGILGLGAIGSRVAAIAKTMGMNVIAWSQNLTAEIASELGVECMPSKEDLLKQSDVITIHLRLSERTHNLIDAKAFALMKPTAMLINTSRAEIVDQTAMSEALSQKRIAAAAADVFDQEPLPKDHPLRALPNFLGVPHLGYVTDSNYHEYFSGAIEAIQAYISGNPIRELYPSGQQVRGLTP